MPLKYRRRARKPLMRKRKFGGVRKYKKSVANKVTVVKRLGAPIVFNSVYAPTTSDPAVTIVNDGAGSFIASLPTSAFTADTGSIQGTAAVAGALSFQLDSVLQKTDLTNMFDRYKINGVKLDFLFQQNTSDMAGGSLLPVMWGSYDFDDDAPPTTREQIQVKGYCRQRVLNANRNFSIYVKPRILRQAATASGPDISTSDRAPWINSTQSDVTHLGYKFWIDNWLGVPASDSPAKAMLTIQPTYYLSLKDTQ